MFVWVIIAMQRYGYVVKELMGAYLLLLPFGLFQHPKIHGLEALEIGRKLAKEALAGKSQNWKVSTSRGLESSDVSTLGEYPPFNVACSSSDQKYALEMYFEGARKEMRSRRFCPIASAAEKRHQLWPLDKLRLELDEAWPAGAGLAREQIHPKRPYGGGLPRIMFGPTRWRKGFIHVDEMAPLNAYSGQFSANIYLLPPNLDTHSGTLSSLVENGEPTPYSFEALHVWPLGIRSRLDWYKVIWLSKNPKKQLGFILSCFDSLYLNEKTP